MKKINLKRISEILSEKELKNVMGGSGYENIFSSCSSRSTCEGVCYSGAYGQGTCNYYFPYLNNFDNVCACHVN